MTGKRELRHVFGPVPSRRLGRSLGVDLVPYKVCTFDCIYCQVGRTTRHTTMRAEFVPVADVIEEVRQKVAHGVRPDYVTLSGSGEPTLNRGLGEVITGIKRITDVPVAILTNGSLFTDPEVRKACALADLVLPSLDAGDEKLFQYINRPCPGLTLEKLVEGLAAFRAEYHGKIWLEVFLLDGVNASVADIEQINQHIARIRPDRIQLNTAVRPTAEAYAQALSKDDMDRLCRLFRPEAEVIADFSKVHEEPRFAAQREEVLDMLRRRPCTLDDVAAGLAIQRNEAAKHVAELRRNDEIESEWRGDREYFKPK